MTMKPSSLQGEYVIGVRPVPSIGEARLILQEVWRTVVTGKTRHVYRTVTLIAIDPITGHQTVLKESREHYTGDSEDDPNDIYKDFTGPDPTVDILRFDWEADAALKSLEPKSAVLGGLTFLLHPNIRNGYRALARSS
jgi:hypothetical protein